jgi:hypothetical protein
MYVFLSLSLESICTTRPTEAFGEHWANYCSGLHFACSGQKPEHLQFPVFPSHTVGQQLPTSGYCTARRSGNMSTAQSLMHLQHPYPYPAVGRRPAALPYRPRVFGPCQIFYSSSFSSRFMPSRRFIINYDSKPQEMLKGVSHGYGRASASRLHIACIGSSQRVADWSP